MRYTKRGYSKKKKFSYKKKRTTKPSRTFVKKVKKIMDKEVETKQAFTGNNTLINFNSGINAAADYQQIVPSIGQGTGDSQRVGSKITAQKLNIRGYLRMVLNDTVDSTSSQSAIVRLMVVSNRSIANWEQASANGTWLSTLLKKGGTTSAFTGAISDLYAPINRDAFIVHYDKRFYLNQAFLNSIGASPPSTVVSQDIKNMIKFFNINIKCKNKVLKYDNTISSINPLNFSPMLVLGYVKPDNADSPDTLTTRVGLQYDSVFNFQDA